VPNLPLPVFALLEKIPAPAAPPVEDPPITEAPSATRTLATAPVRHHHRLVSSADHDDEGDSDGVLAPSEP
jgi:hypothetical protein